MPITIQSSTVVAPSKASSVDLSDLSLDDAVDNFITSPDDDDGSVDALEGMASMDSEILDSAEEAMYMVITFYTSLFPQPTSEQIQALAVALSLPADAVVSLIEAVDTAREPVQASIDDVEGDDVDLSDIDDSDVGDELLDDVTPDGLDDVLDEDDDLTLTPSELDDIDDFVIASADAQVDPTSGETDEMKIAFNNDGTSTTRPAADDLAIQHDGEPVEDAPDPKTPFGALDGEPEQAA